ncbi:MAG TPA: toll/interleukin-1 receptor domain-containing protein [Trichocoleus sp.]
MGSIFISYRRSDSAFESGAIYDRLASHFGKHKVFKDIYAIPLGVDFAEYLDQAVSKCQVLLVIIGRTWLTTTEDDGTRRLGNPNDFVRIEVASALRRNIPVIPLLLYGVVMPKASDLPEELQPLARRNGAQVRPDPDFHQDMNKVIEGIEYYLKPSIRETVEGDHSGNNTPVVRPGKDKTRYEFRGKIYPKNQLVLAVVRQYLQDNPGTNFEALRQVFPDELHRSFGVVAPLAQAKAIRDKTGYKRHLIEDNEVLKTANGVSIAVCNQWGIGSIGNILSIAGVLGYEIKEIKG